MDTPSIEARENGPLLVRSLGVLRLSDGTAVDAEELFALCRCGGSANKPYCDGTHSRIGFRSLRESQAPLDKVRSYEGREVTILDRRAICSHATHCVSELGAVFRQGERPWIDPDGAPRAAIEEAVRRCPSGALAYAVAGRDIQEFQRTPEIEVEPGGPYRVRGGIRLSGSLQPPNQEHYTLCRCGASKNKPFCDGAHHGIEFDV